MRALVKVILLFDSICSNCGAKAKYTCSNCSVSLCVRCRSREKTDILSNVVVPAGLCKECSKDRLDSFYEGKFNTLSESVTIYANPLDSAPKKTTIDKRSRDKK